jgi:hypothetical protein
MHFVYQAELKFLFKAEQLPEPGTEPFCRIRRSAISFIKRGENELIEKKTTFSYFLGANPFL